MLSFQADVQFSNDEGYVIASELHKPSHQSGKGRTVRENKHMEITVTQFNTQKL